MHSQLSTWTAALALTAQAHFCLAGANSACGPAAPSQAPAYASPIALAASPDGRQVFVACATDNRIAVLDTTANRVTRNIPVPAAPLGLALSKNGTRLYVACGAATSVVCVIDVPRGQIVETFAAGHTAMSPVLSPDEQTLYVCNRFDHDISCLSLRSDQPTRRIRVQREPVAADVTPDGRYLLVANHLHAGRANGDAAAAVVSVIDTAAGEVCREIALPNGSGLLRDLRISPDGEVACVPHVLAKYHYVPLTVDFGWINQNAISLIELRTMTLLGTVPVDEVRSGAANPWAAAWSADGRWLCVTHAGTHELSRIDARALIRKLHDLPARIVPPASVRHARFAFYQRPRAGAARAREESMHDLAFLRGFRERIRLAGWGPRAVALSGSMAYVAHYFSDTIAVVDLAAGRAQAGSVALSQGQSLTPVRQGERWFNDATVCQQGWQSCASCHDADGRMDALNWDLLNDGAHNPKNAKSLLLAHETPPAMSLGIRDRAETAVRAGLRHILFVEAPPEVAPAIDAYLQSLQPVPSPFLVQGRFSAAAERGRRVFQSERTGCIHCHPPPLFTNLKAYDVGTAGDYDKRTDIFDTPTLVELWRTAPYLHDGSAATLSEVLTTKNSDNLHGGTLNLSCQEREDLIAYLLSL
jgi:YVTN family beta-propeller protein